MILKYLQWGAAGLAVVIITTLWLQRDSARSDLEDANTRIETLKQRTAALETVVQGHEQTINDLKDLRAQDAKALTGLAQDYERLVKRDEANRRRIEELESTNETVRAYLGESIPPELASLLNGP